MKESASAPEADTAHTEADPPVAPRGEALASEALLKQRTVDFSKGISLPTSVAKVERVELPHTVARNEHCKTTHQDIILFSKEGLIPIHVMASFKIPSPQDMDVELKRHNLDTQDGTLLIWIVLGNLEETRRKRHQFRDKVVFLDGSGICNGMSLDLLRAIERLQPCE